MDLQHEVELPELPAVPEKLPVSQEEPVAEEAVAPKQQLEEMVPAS